jgi:predicted Zn-dependent peptidase
VGDVTAGEAFAAARRYFGEIPAQPPAAPPADVPLAPLSQKICAEDQSAVPAEALYAMWRMPDAGTAECDAAQVAFQVLGGGAGSRLYKRLARRLSLAQSLYADLQRLIGGNSVGLVVIRAHDGASLGAIETVLDEELELLATEGLGDEELERALAQLESEWLSRTSTYAGRADELSRLTCLLGDPGLAATSVDRLRSVSAAQVRAVAESWLRPHQRVQLTYPHASNGSATEAAR